MVSFRAKFVSFVKLWKRQSRSVRMCVSECAYVCVNVHGASECVCMWTCGECVREKFELEQNNQTKSDSRKQKRVNTTIRSTKHLNASDK